MYSSSKKIPSGNKRPDHPAYCTHTVGAHLLIAGPVSLLMKNGNVEVRDSSTGQTITVVGQIKIALGY